MAGIAACTFPVIPAARPGDSFWDSQGLRSLTQCGFWGWRLAWRGRDHAKGIRALGYEADAQVGRTGFRIDLGIRHSDRPGQYIAAVECDGATYHSALWARERDRLRQDILENLGWQFHRIWSTNWFHRRDSEIRRLAGALEAARQAAGQGIKVRAPTSGARLWGV